MTIIDRKFAVEFFTGLEDEHHLELVKTWHHFNDDALDAVDILLSYFDNDRLRFQDHPEIASGMLDALDAALEGDVTVDRINGIRRLIRKMSKVITL